MIKFFLKKHKTQLIAVLTLLIMFGSGFWCAWQIQANKAKIKQEQCTKVTEDIIILLNFWEKKIGELRKELSKYEVENSRQSEWNGGVE